MESKDIIEFELVEDVRALIKSNEDVRISKALMDNVNSFKNDTILKVVMNIDRGIEIVSIEEVTEELFGAL